jgi:hypothetical protein
MWSESRDQPRVVLSCGANVLAAPTDWT